jgi:hypothetical protein
MREAQLGVAVGKKAIGKTYTTLEIINGYVKGSSNLKPRRCLILDVNDEFEDVKAISLNHVKAFSHHPKIELRRVRPYNSDGSKMSLNDITDTLKIILDNFAGGLLLIEDINKYVSDYAPNDLIGALCTNRHTDTDIIMHFQSIGRISTKVWQNLNWIRFHKNSDSVDKHHKKFDDRHEALKITELLVNKQYHLGNKRFYVTYNCDEEVIYGNYSKAQIIDAIDEYISLNYNKKVKPLLNMRDSKGKIKFTPESANKYVKDLIIKMYLPKK